MYLSIGKIAWRPGLLSFIMWVVRRLSLTCFLPSEWSGCVHLPQKSVQRWTRPLSVRKCLQQLPSLIFFIFTHRQFFVENLKNYVIVTRFVEWYSCIYRCPHWKLYFTVQILKNCISETVLRKFEFYCSLRQLGLRHSIDCSNYDESGIQMQIQ